MKNESQNELPLCPLLKWREANNQIRGYLRGHAEVTLFIIKAHPNENGLQLTGAFIPDDEEFEVWSESDAKAAAENYLLEWLETANARISKRNTRLNAEPLRAQMCLGSGVPLQHSPEYWLGLVNGMCAMVPDEITDEEGLTTGDLIHKKKEREARAVNVFTRIQKTMQILNRYEKERIRFFFKQ